MHNGLARLQAPHHGHVECVSRDLLHGARPERWPAGVTRLGPDVYFDLALSRNFAHQASMYVIWTASLLNLGFSASSAQHLAPSTISPTRVLKSNEPTNSLWWLSWSRSYQTIVPHTRISSVPHTRRNSSERVCGTRYHTLNWKWVCGIPHTLRVCGKRNARRVPWKPGNFLVVVGTGFWTSILSPVFWAGLSQITSFWT